MSWTIWCADPWLISRCAAISCTVMRWFSFTMASTAAMGSDVTTRCAWPGRGESVTELTLFRTSYSICTFAVVKDMHHRTELPIVNEFRWVSPLHFNKNEWECCSSVVHVASGAAIFTLLLRRRVAFLHRTATCRPLLKTMSITVANLQDNRAVFWIFTTLLSFSFDSPSYVK